MDYAKVNSIVFRLGAGEHALKLLAKCYTPGTSEPEGLTLLCLHGAGTHKEQWEPTVEQILLRKKDRRLQVPIREVWSVDWPSHGEAATVNEVILRSKPLFSLVELAGAISAFVQSPYLCGRRIVAIGHSAGLTALLLSIDHFPLSQMPFMGFIFVEHVLCSEDFYAERGPLVDTMVSHLTEITKAPVRRTKWPNRDAALEYMRRKFIWKSWDPRVLGAYVKYGMKDLPANAGVEISTNPEQERKAYDIQGAIDATAQYRRIAPFLPVGFIYGALRDVVAKELQDCIFDPANNILPSSVQEVENAGHMVPQQNPDGLAAAICEVLTKVGPQTYVPSKL